MLFNFELKFKTEYHLFCVTQKPTVCFAEVVKNNSTSIMGSRTQNDAKSNKIYYFQSIKKTSKIPWRAVCFGCNPSTVECVNN